MNRIYILFVSECSTMRFYPCNYAYDRSRWKVLQIL